MPKKKQDPKLVASVEDQERELKYISGKYKIPIRKVRAAISELKFAGKGYRSRKVIYRLLRSWGYVIKTKWFTTDPETSREL